MSDRGLHSAYAADFYASVRAIENANREMPRIGRSRRPADDPLRFGQDPGLGFPVAAVGRIHRDAACGPPRMAVNAFGLTGPNAPLPIAVTELAAARSLHDGDHALARFLDLLNHRFTCFFYRAWAQAQPAVCADRPADDGFAEHLGSVTGVREHPDVGKDAAFRRAKLSFAALLSSEVRTREGLTAILACQLGVPVRVESNRPRRVGVIPEDRSRLAARSPQTALGGGAMIGRRFLDVQTHFRLIIGPLSLARYEAFLPGRSGAIALARWVDLYAGGGFSWDVRLDLAVHHVPRLRLGRAGCLGWTAWLGRRSAGRPATDLVLRRNRQEQLPRCEPDRSRRPLRGATHGADVDSTQ